MEAFAATWVSIHAPARGATAFAVEHIHVLDRFNPRAREGRDYTVECNVIVRKQFQSTRPRGARLSISTVFARQCSFNPRAREGRDLSNKN